MALYALGDLHLHFQVQLKAPGQKDGVWKNHETVFRRYCSEMIRPDDTLVLVGDHSWGRNLSEAEQDLQYISDLPGRKILLRGNHDMFWDAKKTQALNERFSGKLFFLQNNYYAYGEYALVGTKGFTFEGPFMINRKRQVVGWDEKKKERSEKLIDRELERLRISFEAAANDGFTKFIMFLHYPPTNILERSSGFTKMAEEYGAEQVIYAHCHGKSRFHDSILGRRKGIEYSLVSGDFLRWKPMKVLP
ncbi:MAG: metallophosphoesterase [Clostridia bacterium]|nr:metallophosphoesterase [Clostridia bacterium]